MQRPILLLLRRKDRFPQKLSGLEGTNNHQGVSLADSERKLCCLWHRELLWWWARRLGVGRPQCVCMCTAWLLHHGRVTACRSASKVKKPQPPSLPSQCCPEGHVGPCRDHLVGMACAMVITASLPSEDSWREDFLAAWTAEQGCPAHPRCSSWSAGFKSSSAADCLTTSRIGALSSWPQILAQTCSRHWFFLFSILCLLSIFFSSHCAPAPPFPSRTPSVKASYCSVPEHRSHGLPWWLRGRESTCSVGDAASVPRSGRSPEGGHGNPLQ